MTYDSSKQDQRKERHFLTMSRKYWHGNTTIALGQRVNQAPNIMFSLHQATYIKRWSF